MVLLLAACQPAAPAERSGVIFRNGEPRTLLGPELRVGDRAPAFELAGAKLEPVRSSELLGKTVILSVVPSIDTPVCESQTGHLAAAQPSLPANTVLITVSRDLPYAQTRFLETNRVETRMASDYREASFGRAWGLLVKETGLLARSVWIVDAEGRIAYREIVREQGTEPDYDALLKAVARVAGAGGG